MLAPIESVRTAVLDGTGDIIDNGISYKLLPYVLLSLKEMFNQGLI
jgi:hypothetical protein